MQHVKGVVSALTCLLVDETGQVELVLLNAGEDGGAGIVPILYYIIGVYIGIWSFCKQCNLHK